MAHKFERIFRVLLSLFTYLCHVLALVVSNLEIFTTNSYRNKTTFFFFFLLQGLWEFVFLFFVFFSSLHIEAGPSCTSQMSYQGSANIYFQTTCYLLQMFELWRDSHGICTCRILQRDFHRNEVCKYVPAIMCLLNHYIITCYLFWPSR